MSTVIYPARRVITMNRALRDGEAVAVRSGRVLAAGFRAAGGRRLAPQRQHGA